jgi:uncharacterized membrane protein
VENARRGHGLGTTWARCNTACGELLQTIVAGGRIDDVSTHVISQPNEQQRDTVADDEHGSLVRSLSTTLPTALGNLLATLVVLVSLVVGVWSLVATWSGNADAFLPFFQVSVAATVVSLNALYARRTFSYVITLIGAILWLWVSVTPFAPFFQVLLQAITVVIMLAGVVFSTAAVRLSKQPRF